MEMSAEQATRTHFCKFPGCENEARSPVGRYSYCGAHQGQGNGSAAPRSGGSVALQLGSLQGQAKRVDRLRAKAETLTRRALEAKREADDAERAFRVALAGLSPAAP